MARISMGYPSTAAEVEMLDLHGGRSPLDTLVPVTDAQTVARLVLVTQDVYASPAVRQYVVDLANATRTSPAVRLGASPRAALHVLRAARAHAALEARDHVLPDDVQRVAPAVLGHRLMLSGEATLAHRSPAEVLAEILRSTPVPIGRR
jgi:MoxR-like ATPase